MLKAWTRIFEWTKTSAGQFYPGWKSWIFFSFLLSLLFLVLSGFLFALLIPRGLFGLPLLLHVAAGGIFAVCLSLVVVWRAGDYTLDAPSPPFLKALFWVFVISGLCLIVTALSSMLSFLSMQIQISMIRWHRLFAIVSLFCVSAFVNDSFSREK
ncbi:MAG: hypothetical protein MUP98_02110 [Candidatus Aminicenantes bacterium]|nr:hypothetical protein [Candidatus Aminicenantes bacterium]